MAEYEEFQKLQRNGKTTEEILGAMKDRGLTVIQAIKASMELFGLSLGQAKSLVTSQPSWHATVEASRPLHDELIKALRDAGDTVLEYEVETDAKADMPSVADPGAPS